MRLLVLAGDTVSADRLREAVGDQVDPARAEVMVLAPAYQDSPLKFWFSDADEAIARADAVRQQTVTSLREDGVPATGRTGESDPVAAIQDAMQTFAPDRIVIFASPGASHYREDDLDPDELQTQFGVPVTRVAAG